MTIFPPTHMSGEPDFRWRVEEAMSGDHVSRRGGAHAEAAPGLETSARSLGQIAGPVLGGVLFGASVAVPFWLACGLLLGLAPIFAWSRRRTHEPPGARSAKGKLAFGRQEAR